MGRRQCYHFGWSNLPWVGRESPGETALTPHGVLRTARSTVTTGPDVLGQLNFMHFFLNRRILLNITGYDLIFILKRLFQDKLAKSVLSHMFWFEVRKI